LSNRGQILGQQKNYSTDNLRANIKDRNKEKKSKKSTKASRSIKRDESAIPLRLSQSNATDIDFADNSTSENR
jgi:hypothetical protein